ncbi:unnamed protein product [Clonostachys rosea]|uniref:Methyltransferase type 11 domain-containing protein n=1 Tax=Bionectria ochroleuca TaxID=29856 RepID=A0ABY6U2C6_BIOOC|nr:unnamed protein product [Clonostachys rosea]
MTTTLETIQQLFSTLTHPWVFMAISASHIPLTIRTLIRNRDWRGLLVPSAFCDALFGHFWATAGPMVKAHAEVRVIPLLEGRVKDGEAHDHVVGLPVSGKVIEIGAGSGMWADVFCKINTSGNATNDTLRGEGASSVRKRMASSAITKIYGVEPNPESVRALRKRVKDIGLDDIYEVVPVGIESLSDPSAFKGEPIEPGSIDCIVSVLCLCSVPNQKENIEALYKLLKPGGRWYVYEHVKVKRSGLVQTFLSLYQRFVNVPWSFFIGSCRLCNNTGEHLREAGSWSAIDLVRPASDPVYQLLPHVWGTLTK